MSNSSGVELIVRTIDFNKHEELFEGPQREEAMRDGFHLLGYDDVKFANLGIESTLQLRRIPYDKSWDSGDEYSRGSEYCRVLSNGGVTLQEFESEKQSSVDLPAAIEAYENGTIAEFLEESQREREVMSWEDQQVIISCRDKTMDDLLQLDQDALDELVTEVCCELSCKSEDGINSKLPPSDQEVELTAVELSASEINNDGRDLQIDFLLNAGYLSQGLSCHNPSTYSLGETKVSSESGADQNSKPRYLPGACCTEGITPIQHLANKTHKDLLASNTTLSGNTKNVCITLSALTRQEYSETVVVPVELNESMLKDLSELARDNVDGGHFNDDPEYWEEGSCTHQEI